MGSITLMTEYEEMCQIDPVMKIALPTEADWLEYKERTKGWPDEPDETLPFASDSGPATSSLIDDIPKDIALIAACALI